jgi:ABC-type multidrug transport system fused ATPase/permease subunit
LPDVLHGLTFEVKPGEKVGLIGRTGSGKSTVALAFMRFVEAREGRILIDGLDIAKIGLTDLRSRLTIVPRESYVSYELEIFNQHMVYYMQRILFF